MPQSEQNRSAELHNLAEHTHEAAARDKTDHLTPHELTKQADEHSRKAHERDGQRLPRPRNRTRLNA